MHGRLTLMRRMYCKIAPLVVVIMAALCNRTGRYIFCPVVSSFYLSIFFPRLFFHFMLTKLRVLFSQNTKTISWYLLS